MSLDRVSNHKSVWSDVSLPCWSSESRSSKWHFPFSPEISEKVEGDQGKFAASFWENTDICRQHKRLPSGLIKSPESIGLTHDAVPILSSAKLSTFADILFPSPWRFQEHQTHAPNEDCEWQNKTSTIYWRGSTTGGHGSNKSWSQLHRQALIRHLQQALSGRRKELDVAFTDVIQCDASACDAERATLPMDERRPMSDGWKHKILLDVDGNGLSGRLYGLLRSKSAVLRHSFMREWHDRKCCKCHGILHWGLPLL